MFIKRGLSFLLISCTVLSGCSDDIAPVSGKNSDKSDTSTSTTNFTDQLDFLQQVEIKDVLTIPENEYLVIVYKKGLLNATSGGIEWYQKQPNSVPVYGVSVVAETEIIGYENITIEEFPVIIEVKKNASGDVQTLNSKVGSLEKKVFENLLKS